MKKITLFLLCFTAVLAGPATVNMFSQQTSGSERVYKFTVKTNPLAAMGGPFWVVVIPVTGEYKAYFETAVTGKTSFQLGVSYIGPSVLVNLDEITRDESGEEIKGLKTGGFRVQGTYKLFMSRDLTAPEGFYFGPNVSYASASIKNKANLNEKINATKLNISGLLGYQMITSGGFTLDVFMGLGYVSRKFDISGENFDPDDFKTRSSVAVPVGFALGYAF